MDESQVMEAEATETEAAEPEQAPEESQGIGLEADQAGVDEDGNVQFGDAFFDKEEDAPEKKEPAPEYYTAEDLGKTSLDAVDVARLDPARIGDYWGMLQRVIRNDRDQICNLQAQIEQLRRGEPQQEAKPAEAPAPAQAQGMDRRALTEAAVQQARKMLDLPEDEDLDLYEPDHQMAFAQAAAMQAQQMQTRQRNVASYQSLQEFHRQMEQRPDFGEFSQWFDAQLKKNGRTAEQVQQSLAELVEENGGDYGIVRGVIGKWYQDYLAGKKAKKAPAPPVLEGARGGNDGRKVMDLNRFSGMTAEEQEKALIAAGIV